MSIAFNDWFYHLEHTCWTGFPEPAQEVGPHRPFPIPSPEYKPRFPCRRSKPLGCDTKPPPPGEMEKLRGNVRAFVLNCLLATFSQYRIETMIVSISAINVKLLARFPGDPCHWVGHAKRHATIATRRLFELPKLRIWAHHGMFRPISDQDHLLSTRDAILLQHRDGIPLWFPPSAYEAVPTGSVPKEW